MTESNSNSWENWERNTDESQNYADFILKELGSITNTVSTIYIYPTTYGPYNMIWQQKF